MKLSELDIENLAVFLTRAVTEDEESESVEYLVSEFSLTEVIARDLFRKYEAKFATRAIYQTIEATSFIKMVLKGLVEVK